MRIVIVAVGKVKEKGLREVVDDYLRRVRRHVPTDEIELRDGRTVGASIEGALPSQGHVVALDQRGESMTSEQLAKHLSHHLSIDKGNVAFVIGGADGLPSHILSQAHIRLSLSSFTLAHRVARVVLAEQLYRAVSIWRGEPYHR